MRVGNGRNLASREGLNLKTHNLVLVALFTALIVALGLVPPITVPWVPLPLTLQTFGVMLAGLILGPVRAGLALLLYVTLALLGLPVLPGGRAGLTVLAGPTAGFLLGMIPGAILTGWLAGDQTSKYRALTTAPIRRGASGRIERAMGRTTTDVQSETNSGTHISPSTNATSTNASTSTSTSRAGSVMASTWFQVVRCGLAAIFGGIVLVYVIGIPWLALVAKMEVEKVCWAMLVFLPGDLFKAIVAALVAQRIRRLALV